MSIEEKFDDYINGYFGDVVVPNELYIGLYDAFAAGIVLAARRAQDPEIQKFVERHLQRLDARLLFADQRAKDDRVKIIRNKQIALFAFKQLKDYIKQTKNEKHGPEHKP